MTFVSVSGSAAQGVLRHATWRVVRIRRFSPEDAPAFRELRLRALRDAPHAFASSLAQEEPCPLAEWEERVRRAAAGPDEVGFFAVEGEAPVGMVGAYLDAREGEPDVAHLVAMWVAPEMRGRGVGSALTRAVLGWAGERGARLVKLWVTTTNLDAVRLYERCGFGHTGRVEPLPSDPKLSIERLERVP